MSSTHGWYEKTPKRQQKPPHQAAKASVIHGSDPDTEGEESDSLPLLRVGGQTRQPIVVKLTVDGRSILMEVDTEAAVSVISSVTGRTAVPTKRFIGNYFTSYR